MCGIFGLVTPSNIKQDKIQKWSEFGLRSILNRGPDNSKTKVHNLSDSILTLAHTRLSIIAPGSASNQPMYSGCERFVLIYNGEIYNYLELREKLLAKGTKFKTASDSEVLLQCWIKWGSDCLHLLNGMFAFCIVDLKNEELFLVRDRFGVKPLYYFQDTCFCFSSSAEGVANVFGFEPNLNFLTRGTHYSVFEYGDSTTQFEKVKALPPGHILNLKLKDKKNKPLPSEWYSLERAVRKQMKKISGKSEQDLVHHAFNLLEKSVSVRLRSDVPLALSLSGGLDSTAIGAVALDKDQDLHGFTYGSPNEPGSEGGLVELFSKHKQITNHFVWPNFEKQELIKVFERTLKHQEAPFSSLSVMAQNEVFTNASTAGFKVILGGQGGDEIFAGYRKFFFICLRNALQRRDLLSGIKFSISLFQMLLAESFSIKNYLANLNRYNQKSTEKFKLFDLPLAPINLWGAKEQSLHERQIEDIKKFSLPTLLRYEDKNSMGNGIESRLPFMDYRLVEFALALPEELKIQNGYGKWVLRKIFEKQIPNKIRLSRTKRGFDVTQCWIKSGLGNYLRDLILDNKSNLPFLNSIREVEAQLTTENLMSNRKLLSEAISLRWLQKIQRG